MFIKKSFFILILISFISKNLYSQKIENWNFSKVDAALSTKIDTSKNVLENSNSLNPLFAKLYKVKHFSKENAVFVHIGDSHIQADMMTSVIRNELQNYFGNAGRGLVFPYQVAKSNAPFDIISSSKSTWKSNRVARADTLTTCGISAFGMESQQTFPELNLELRTINGFKDSFDKVSFFLGGSISEINLEYNTNLVENRCISSKTNFEQFQLKEKTSGFKVAFPSSENLQFFGASLEKNDASGILYHSIGANGAKFSDYTKTSTFWQQLDYLNADCYIISLGTNEAQDPNLTSEGFLLEVKSMVDNIKKVSPEACIILTSPPVSYFKRLKPNGILVVQTNALQTYCDEYNLIFWDLFNSCKGLEGAKIWRTQKLLRPDLVHFSKEGYELQGNLFVAAFSKVWNDFLDKIEN